MGGIFAGQFPISGLAFLPLSLALVALMQPGPFSPVDCDKSFVILIAWQDSKTEPRFSGRKARLTAEEFASLQEVGNRPMQRTIPDEHRDRLIAAGYIRAVVPYSVGVSALALTGAGLRRLEAGK